MRLLEELNLGGGFGIAYLRRGRPGQPRGRRGAGCARSIAAECAELGLPVPRLAVEPGRAIAGPGTVTLYEIGTIKPVRLGASGAPGTPLVRNYVSVDGGMSDNIRTALYDANYTCVLANRSSDAPPALCRVVGKHCESGDILVRDLWLPADVQPGDLLAVAATGAYCWSMASNYNYLLKPPVVAVRDGAATEIVRRQTLADVFALDAVLADAPGTLAGTVPACARAPGGSPLTSVTKPLKVALLGCGTVGSAVLQLLDEQADDLPPASAAGSRSRASPSAGPPTMPTSRRTC